jgi:hypothetical protein
MGCGDRMPDTHILALKGNAVKDFFPGKSAYR